MASISSMDGSKIKAFVESEQSFSAFVDRKFDAMDTDHDGAVSQTQLEPVVQSLGEALGLPPIGTSAETDHMYEEVFPEFTTGTPVRKDEFGTVLRDILLGLADGLERDPITVMVMDGTQLRGYVASEQFETDTVSKFTRLDAEQVGRVQANRLLDVFPSISVAKGMPPASDPRMRKLAEEAVGAARVDVGEYVDQMQFVEVLRKVLLGLADFLGTNTIKTAHSEKRYDGQSIRKLIQNHDEVEKVLDESWRRVPKDHHHKTSKDYLRISVEELGPPAGLPPVGSVDELDHLIDVLFEKFDLNDGKTIGQKEFNKCIMDVLGSLMLQLGEKPIFIECSQIVED